MSKMKVLFLTNLGIDMGLPLFRIGSINTFLIPMMLALSKSRQTDTKLLVSKYIYGELCKQKNINSIKEKISFLEEESLRLNSLENFMVSSYDEELSSNSIAIIQATLSQTLNNWQPDVIISWETPTNIFRKIYPKALVLDIMPSLFMRPPFPRMISFDPIGLYKNAWYSSYDLEKIPTNSKNLEDFLSLKEYYKQHLQSNQYKNKFAEMTNNNSIENSLLAPLQITEYFGWKKNCTYPDQFTLVKDILESYTDIDRIMFTQYTGGLIEEHVINNNNEAYLNSTYKNFYYNKNFEKLDNISQYLLPNSKGVVSISSTLGFQAKFFDKTLVSPGFSHLSYLADSTDLNEPFPASNRNLDSFLSAFIGRTCYLEKKLTKEDNYLYNILSDFLDRKNNNNSGIEIFPDYLLSNNTYDQLTITSNLAAAERNFRRKLYSRQESLIVNEVVNLKKCDHYAAKIDDDQISTISFDVFDTLVTRTVFKPNQIFELMQNYLMNNETIELPGLFIDKFPILRDGEEKLQRKLRDKSISETGIDIDEEILIENIYKSIVKRFNLPDNYIDFFINLEQKIELQNLVARKSGKEIYRHAINSRKKIIIVSDFIHPKDFVEKVLKENGFTEFDQIFVSSDIKKKKHSGRLFKYILKSTDLLPKEILHIGDNPIGDIKRANELGIKTHHLPSGLIEARNKFKERNWNFSAIEKSMFAGALLSAYMNRETNNDCRDNNEAKNNLIQTERDLGYLVLGPIMHQFALWILEEARKNNCKQIIFFARDTILSHKILSEILKCHLTHKIKTIYIPVSRISVTGLDIFQPTDLYNVRIDDFSPKGNLQTLLESRFLIHKDEICIDSLNTWEIKDPGKVRKKDLTDMAIYNIAIESAKKNWTVFLDRQNAKRTAYSQLIEELGGDLDSKSIAVDLGYTGTIQKKIQALFSQPLLPRFFMSYAGNSGNNKLDNLNVFWNKDMLPQFKNYNPFLKYNLVFETLVNESCGSVLNVVQTQCGKVEVIKEHLPSKDHKQTIDNIHKGALEFSETWASNYKALDELISPEKNMLEFFFASIMQYPTKKEAQMLSQLVFDNPYSGAQPRKIIPLDSNGFSKNLGIWPEGDRILSKKDSKKIYKFRNFSMKKLMRYRKYKESKILLKFRHIMPNALITRLEKRMEKYSDH